MSIKKELDKMEALVEGTSKEFQSFVEITKNISEQVAKMQTNMEGLISISVSHNNCQETTQKNINLILKSMDNLLKAGLDQEKRIRRLEDKFIN